MAMQTWIMGSTPETQDTTIAAIDLPPSEENDESEDNAESAQHSTEMMVFDPIWKRKETENESGDDRPKRQKNVLMEGQPEVWQQDVADGWGLDLDDVSM